MVNLNTIIKRFIKSSAFNLGSANFSVKFPLFIFAFLALNSAGYAENETISPDNNTNSLKMTAKAGFAGRIKLGCYFPVRITLENTGAARKGEIRIISEDISRPLPDIFIAECEIPSNSRKTFYLYPYFLLLDPSPEILVQYIEKAPIITERITLKFLAEEDRLWIEVADEKYDFLYLSGLKLPEYPTISELGSYVSEITGNSNYAGYSSGYKSPISSQGNIKFPEISTVVVGSRIEDLPDHFEGYQGIDGLILNSRKFYAMSDNQREALSDWVLSGGNLITWLGDDPLRYKGSFLTCAVDGSNVRQTSAITEAPIRTTIRSLTRLSGFLDSPPLDGAFPVTYTKQSSARTLLAEGSTPILQYIKFGLGDIVLSGLDLSSLKQQGFQHLDNYFCLLMSLLEAMNDNCKAEIKISTNLQLTWGYGSSSPNPFRLGTFYRLLYDLDNAIQSDNLTALPSLGNIAMFLVVYILIIGPANYFVLSLVKRRDWLWYTIPVLVIAFCAFFYGLALKTKGNELLQVRLNIRNCFPELGKFHELSAFGLFSPASRHYHIKLSDSRNLVRPIKVGNQTFSWNIYGMSGQIEKLSPYDVNQLVQSDINTNAYIRDSYIRIWSEKHYYSCGVSDFNSNVRADNVFIKDNHLKGLIHYSFNFALENPHIIYRTKDGYITRQLNINQANEINNNGSIEFDLPLNDYTDKPSITLDTDNSDSTKRATLRTASLSMLTNRQIDLSSQDELLLVGWSKEPSKSTLISPAPGAMDSIEETLVIIHVPILIRSTQISKTDLGTALLNIMADKPEITDKEELVFSSGEILLALSFSHPLSNAKSNVVQLDFSSGPTANRFIVNAFNHVTGEWVQLNLIKRFDNIYSIQLNKPENFLAPDQRTIFMSLKNDPSISGNVSLKNISIHEP